MTKVHIKVSNARTCQVEIDSTVTLNGYDFDIAKSNYDVFRSTFPECCVTFTMDNGDFISNMPLEQEQDEDAMDCGFMTWNEYCDKWCPSARVDELEEY